MDNTESDFRTNSRVMQFIIWFLFIAAGFGVCARLGIKYAMTHALALDDKLIISSLVVYLGQCIAISIAVSTYTTPPSSNAPGEDSMKAQYASVPLMILALALVKWSNYAFIRQLSPKHQYKRAALALAAVVGLWLVSAALAGLLQCVLPKPWDSSDTSHCINRRAWWAFVVVLNILTDICLVGLYFFIIVGLQVPRTKKTVIIVAFSTRLVVVGIALAQLTASRVSGQQVGITPNSRLSLALNQAMLGFSVITACIPYLKPFMQGLQAGVNRVDNTSQYEDELIRLPQPPTSSRSSETHWSTRGDQRPRAY
ncbi:hypothetical protein F5Y10DRAFT_289259 [Nemania abortiva]|nr:hypothetical protein F5Y10DRAFT_289259 [Nemania abortiva]